MSTKASLKGVLSEKMSLIMKQKGVQESRLVAIWASRSIRHFLVRDKAFAWTSTPHFSILPTTVQETNCN